MFGITRLITRLISRLRNKPPAPPQLLQTIVLPVATLPPFRHTNRRENPHHFYTRPPGLLPDLTPFVFGFRNEADLPQHEQYAGLTQFVLQDGEWVPTKATEQPFVEPFLVSRTDTVSVVAAEKGRSNESKNIRLLCPELRGDGKNFAVIRLFGPTQYVSVEHHQSHYIHSLRLTPDGERLGVILARYGSQEPVDWLLLIYAVFPK